MARRFWGRGTGIFAFLTACTAVVGLTWPSNSDSGGNVDAAPVATTTTAVPTPTTVATATTVGSPPEAPPIDWTDPSRWPELPTATLEDPGPGRCFPDVLAKRRQMAANGDFKPFEAASGPVDFHSPYSQYEVEVVHGDILEIIKVGKVEATRPNCLEDLARWLKDHEDYTLVSEVIGHEFDPANRDDLVRYYQKVLLVELPADLAVQNHFFTESDGVQTYRMEKLPKGELVFFVPGFQPGNEANHSVRPVDKLVCGNPLLPPPPPPEVPPTTQPAPPTTTTVATTTTTTRPSSSSSTSTTTTTRCESGKCVPPTTVAAPPTTQPAPTTTTTVTTTTTSRTATTWQPPVTTYPDSGDGATNTTVAPTTSSPAPAPPTTASPTVTVPSP